MFYAYRKFITAAAVAAVVVSLTSEVSSAIALERRASTCGWDTAGGWVQRENAKAGLSSWSAGIPVEFAGDFSGKEKVAQTHSLSLRSLQSPGAVVTGPEGWFSSSSATCGQVVPLHISGNGLSVKISVFRMGYYGGAGARLVEKTVTKSIAHFRSQMNHNVGHTTITTNWPTAWNFKISRNTLPGQYLVRLDDSTGDSNFVPIMVTNPDSHDAVTFISSVLTWQSYNAWGNFSLYKGKDLSRATRSTVASFNRPYDGDGSGQFRYMEYPLIRMTERLGIDLNYMTDLELHGHRGPLLNTKSIFLGGHSEYWTTQMRNVLDSSVAHGINLVSFGGNAGYNRPRLAANNRDLIMWRGASTDPNRMDPVLATTRWRSAPVSRPEASLLGSQYVGLGVNGNFNITRPARWPFAILNGRTILKSVVGREVDSPLYSGGPAVENLAWSKLMLKGKPITAIATYYNNANKAGVIDISTNGWVCAIDNVCPWHPAQFSETSRSVQLVTQEILQSLSKGPMGAWHPAIFDIAKRNHGSKF